MRTKGRIALVVYGFAHTVQFDLLAGNDSWMNPKAREIVREQAKYLINQSRDRRLLAASVSRVRDSMVLLLQLPVDAIEHDSGRQVSSVIFGAVVDPYWAVDKQFYLQALALLSRAIGNLDPSDTSLTHPHQAGQLIARLAQDGYSAMLTAISERIEATSSLLSLVLSSSGQRFQPWRRSGLRTCGSISGVSTHDPVFALPFLTLGTAVSTGAAQLGTFVPSGGIDVPEALMAAQISAHQFIPDGLIVCHRDERE